MRDFVTRLLKNRKNKAKPTDLTVAQQLTEYQVLCGIPEDELVIVFMDEGYRYGVSYDGHQTVSIYREGLRIRMSITHAIRIGLTRLISDFVLTAQDTQQSYKLGYHGNTMVQIGLTAMRLPSQQNQTRYASATEFNLLIDGLMK